jgi:hypothetical protein
MSSSWYTDHPVVSTVLWLMGSPTSLDEEEEQKPTRCLSWKDEHDGGPIAEYMSAPKSPQIGVNFSNVEEPANSSMSRKQSLPALPRNDSDVCLLISFQIYHLFSFSCVG